MTLILTRSVLAKILDMGQVIDAVESAMRDLSTGDAVQPERSAFMIRDHETLFVPMPSGLSSARAAGIKFMTDVPSNVSKGRPRQQSLIMISDAETGAVKALIDGGLITQFRTAAASAVATKHLSLESSHRLGFLGAGSQARSHLKAIKLVRPIDKVTVWSRTEDTARKFADFGESIGVEVVVAQSVREVVDEADILCTLTPSREPIIEGGWLRPGMHINAVGAPPRDDHREIDTDTMLKSKIFVDDFGVAMAESGAIKIPLSSGDLNKEDFKTSIGEVIAGVAKGRTSDEDITLFNSVGLAIQDMAAAHIVIERAIAEGLGSTLDFSK